MWASRDFRIAWTAGLVNNTGDWALLVGLPVFVFTETGSGTTTAVLFVVEMLVAAALGPIGGALVDRWDLRRTLLATNLAQAAALVPLLAVDADRVWPAYVVVLAQSVLRQLNDPANIALVPRLVDPAQLTQANAAIGAGASIARLAGAPLGGLAVAVAGLEGIVVIDAVSFLGIAALVTFLRTPTGPLAGDAEQPPAGVRAGLATIASHPVLRGFVAITLIVQVAQGGFVLLYVVFMVERLGSDSTEIGTVRGLMAVGAVAGAFVIGRVAGNAHPLLLQTVGMVGMGAIGLVFWNFPAITTQLWVYVVIFALTGFPGAALQVGFTTAIQTLAPPGAVGRVAGAVFAAGAIGEAVGSIVTGALVDSAPLRLLLNVQAAIYVVCALPMWLLYRRTAAPRGT